MKDVFKVIILFLLIAAHTLYAKSGDLKWDFNLSTIGYGWGTSAALADDGTIYIGADKLYALDSNNGSKKWEKVLIGPLKASPMIGFDGTVFIAVENGSSGRLYAIAPDGTEVWHLDMGPVTSSSVALASDGTLYVGSTDHKLYAVSSNGVLKWTFQTGGAIISSPALGPGGIVYFGSNDGKLYAVTPEGKLAWSYATGGELRSSPAIGPEGNIYIGSMDGKLYAVKPDGTLKWEYTAESAIDLSPVITLSESADELQMLFCAGKNIYYLKLDDGSEVLKRSFNIETHSSPTLGSTVDMITVGSDDGKVHFTDGNNVWDYQTNGKVQAIPTVGPDGTVYIGSMDGRFYAIEGSSNGWESQYWSKVGRDNKHRSSVDGMPWIRTRSYNDTEAVGLSKNGDILYVGLGQFLGAYEGIVEKWHESISGIDELFGAVTVGEEMLYVTSTGGKLYAVNESNGSVEWSFDTGGSIYASAAIAADGTLYVGDGNYLYAITPDGTEKWRFRTNGNIKASAAIGKDGTIYVGSEFFYAINPDGSKKWSFATGDKIIVSPAIGSDGTLYFGAFDNKFYALEPNGSLKWAADVVGYVTASPAIAPDGTIYFATDGGKVYAYTPQGVRKWERSTLSPFCGHITISSSGTVLLSTEDTYLYAFSQKGDIKWKYLPNNRAIRNLVIDKKGYLEDPHNAIMTTSHGLADSPWPKLQQNNQHTGRRDFPLGTGALPAIYYLLQ